MENHTSGHMQKLWESSIKNFSDFFKIIFFTYSDKATLSLLAVKYHTHSFFSLGDILNYIRQCSSFTMRGTAIILQIEWFVHSQNQIFSCL